MTTYYTSMNRVKLKPGQTFGFTPGKGYYGYYPAGKPTPPKPPAKPPPKTAAKPTATRPVAAKTPTAPPSKPAHRSAAPAAQKKSAAKPETSPSTAYYSKRSEVHLQHGQTLAYTAGKGYYAAGRPNPTKASKTPKPSHVKVTAVSTKGSTKSPLKADGDTKGYRHAKATHAHTTNVKTKKATSHAHHQVAKNKKHTTKHRRLRLLPGGKRTVQGVQQLATSSYLISTAIATNVSGGVEATYSDGNLVFTSDGTVVYSMPVGGLNALEASATLDPDGFAASVTANLPTVPGVTTEVTVGSNGAVTLTIKGNGVENTITFKPEGEIEIETSVKKDIQGQSVELKLTTTLTPAEPEKAGQPATRQSKPAPKPAKKPVTKPVHATKPVRASGRKSGAGEGAEESGAERGAEAGAEGGGEGVVGGLLDRLIMSFA